MTVVDPFTAGDVTPAPYTAPADAPKAILVDLDGTTALMCDRSPFDWGRVGEDLPNQPVIAAVEAMHVAGHRVVFCSGRMESCRQATEAWLAEHVEVRYEALYMRKSGDVRKDSVVKVEIFDRHIRDQFDVVCVFDDRRQVVDAWRALGLTVFQVAPGDF